MTAPEAEIHLRCDGKPSAHSYNHQRTPRPFHLYRVYGRRSGLLLYVGITTDVRRRMSEHGRRKWREAVRVEAEMVGPQSLARILETVAIRQEHPRDNCMQGDATGSGVWEYLDTEGMSLDELAERHRVAPEAAAAWVDHRRRRLEYLAQRELVRTPAVV